MTSLTVSSIGAKLVDTPSTNASSSRTITLQQAALDLGVSYRHTVRLVKSGELVAVGDARHRRVTLRSVENYRSKRRFSDLHYDMSYEGTPGMRYQNSVERMVRTIPPLSPVSRAARRLGIPVPQFEGLVRGGHVPSVVIGSEVFVKGRWLVEVLNAAAVTKEEECSANEERQ